MNKSISRRDFIKAGAFTLLGTSGAAVFAQMAQKASAAPPSQEDMPMHHTGATPCP